MENQEDPNLRMHKAVDRLADDFEVAFLAGQPQTIERILQENAELRRPLLRELIAIEVELRKAAGSKPDLEEFLRRFPDDRELVESAFIPATEMASTSDRSFDSSAAKNAPPLPERLGRYVIHSLLGRGGFGFVYLAHDPQLDRQVAIKVPRPERFTTAEQVSSFLQEARTAAKLKHPGLVAVYDVQEEAGVPYIVQEYIEGGNLALWNAHQKPTFEQIARILIGVTEALGYLHQQRLTHCDLKLANVLMDHQGQPHIADFGWAMQDSMRASQQGARFGTPIIMAPEQVRGEGHRLDGRTDIWAMGVMLYELLVNQRPFTSRGLSELFNEIETLDPRPPRQIDPRVPRDLERICLRCLQKRRTERYSTAEDLREDLESWLANAFQVSTSTLPGRDLSDRPPPKIVPKGLRSFDAEDADFFLDLLPGPRDRDGLPSSLRFWKNRIEARNSDRTFSVGLIYGPSGCGKSSFVKAGLLPRLSQAVLPIYVEATAAETETRLLKQLNKHLPRGASNLTLSEVFAELRKSGATRHGKLLIVIDQCEQWLQTHPDLKQSQLIDALRQCEGDFLQAIVLVRDDFFSGVHRLFQELECPLIEGFNYALIDRFDSQHAKKVLTSFGTAFGKVDDQPSEDQMQFVSQAVNQLAEGEKVISVRLALFAEMMKSRPWTPASLKEIGGVPGVGVTFLEETFSSNTTSPIRRIHELAIRQVLKKLLPDPGIDIKGGMQSETLLREAAGYQSEPARFAEVIRILDQERIITPTEPAESEKNEARSGNLQAASSNFELQSSHLFYQLTHDYLVPSLREWLTRKQRETRKGLAELKLAERAATWVAKQEDKQLPSVSEWLSIRMLTDSNKWTALEKTVMRRAARVHGTWCGGLALATLLLGFGIQQWISSERWKNLQAQTQTAVDALQNNLGPSVPFNLEKLATLPRELVLPELQTRFASATNPRHKLALAFALAHYGDPNTDYLISRVNDVTDSDSENYITAVRSDATSALGAIQVESKKLTGQSSIRRKAKFAVLELNLGKSDLASDMCAIEGRSDPEQRTVFIDEFPRWKNRLADIHDLVASSESPALRSGICLGVGQIAADEIAFDERELWDLLASRWFVDKGDTATHSGAGWLLRSWGRAEPGVPDQEKIVEHRDWFVNSVGATMLRLPEALFKMPDPLYTYRMHLMELSQKSDLELEQTQRRITRAYANFELGNNEAALEDLDWFAGKEPDLLGLRSLVLARLGKEEDAKKTLAMSVQHEGLRVPYENKKCLEIEVTALIGDFVEATRQLDSALSSPQKTQNLLLEIASAASRCSQAAAAKNPEQAKQFADRAITILTEVFRNDETYEKEKFWLGRPQFANLHADVRFVALYKEVMCIEDLWVQDREVSRGGFELFMNDTSYPTQEKPENWEGVDKKISPTADHPAQKVSWHDAVLFCNWLSLREGFKPRYQRGPDNSWRLMRGNGYRLLSAKEWERACRAGTKTDYSSGNDVALLTGYAQLYPSELTRICGTKLPNRWGLHDMHGNVFEWCDHEFGDAKGHIHGGDWHLIATMSRSADYVSMPRATRDNSTGFRICLGLQFD